MPEPCERNKYIILITIIIELLIPPLLDTQLFTDIQGIKNHEQSHYQHKQQLTRNAVKYMYNHIIFCM